MMLGSIKGISTLFIGTIISQIVPFLFLPVLTKIYSPEELGALTNLLTLVIFLSTLFLLRLETAIVLVNGSKYIGYIVSLCISLILFGVCIIILISIVLYTIGFLSLELVFYIPLFLFFYGVLQILHYFFLKEKDYRSVVLLKIFLAMTTVFFQFILSFLGFDLIFPSILAYFITIALFFSFFDLKWLGELKFNISRNRKKVICQLVRYRNIPIYTAPATLIDTGKNLTINALVTYFFGVADFGQFSLALRMMQAPLQLLNSVVGQYFLSQMAGESIAVVYRYLLRYIVLLSVISFIPFLFLYYYVVDIFYFFFGSEWEVSGLVAKSIIPWLFLNCISSPVSLVYIVIEKQKTALYLSVLNFVFAMVGILWPTDTMVESVTFFSNVMAAYLLLYILFTLIYMRAIKSYACSNNS